MAAKVGSNLRPVRGKVQKDFSNAMNGFMKMIEGMNPSFTAYGRSPAFKLFTKTGGAPATDTYADDPGSDLCFIWDVDNLDLYFAHSWVPPTGVSSTFTILQVL